MDASVEHPVVPLWRNRSFGLLWIGQLTSEFGTGLLRLAVLLHVYASTGSTAATTAAFVAETAPFALLSPWAGALADRVDRRRLLIGADLVRAVLLLPLLVETNLVVLLTVLAAQAAVGAVFRPAYGAFVPTVVPATQLATGNAFSAGTASALNLVAPTVGAALYAGFGFTPLVVIDAVTFLVSVVTLLCLSSHVTARATRPRVSLREDLAVAVQLIRTTPVLRLLFATMLCFAMVESTLGPLYVPYLQGTLDATTTEVGFALSAQSLGSLLGGLVVVAVARWLGAARMFVLGAVAASVLISVFAMAPSYGVAIAALAVMGIPGLFTNVGSMTLMQTRVPDEVRGRVIGGFYAMFGVATLVGAALPGFASGLLGVRAVVMIGAAFAVAAAVMAWSGRHQLQAKDVDEIPTGVVA